jgi:hypothetical protein
MRKFPEPETVSAMWGGGYGSHYGYVNGQTTLLTDPSGMATQQRCAALSLSFVGGWEGSLCFVNDDKGGAGLAFQNSAGGGLRASATAGISRGYSDGKTIDSLRGASSWAGGSVGTPLARLSVNGKYSWATDSEGCAVHQVDVGVGVGIGIPFEGAVGRAEAEIWRIPGTVGKVVSKLGWLF